ncbi:hypothetical protein MBM_04994 [Drepanopeziza brunnea f. sp. 'multigermtubi' MB_m1]|uniref:Uncharacterized protein n=1 Tax=Marssonina brunnea f. sp. multigermtubi (strain MB_m1) TaxID=1072389 RepID=K1WG69_MARBU|nr:uncharacterized protein MBM_04994 [Drepanopeziza brunnea f. sp. 'multigermtubi' MB_m1]EKD16525.1 hypothetical protein MBM_04994 [Drepanopeziza brunnea f. sp. 'multigermtubi' MB_m1]
MGSGVVDLTSSSPAASEQGGILGATPRPPVALQPPIPAGHRANARPAPASVVSAALRKSIDNMDKRLRAYGKDAARYHVDTDSEEDVNGETSSKDGGEEEEEDGSECGGKNEERVKWLRPISIGDEEFVPKQATCKNCDEQFDVDVNKKGDCQWHTGKYYVEFDKSLELRGHVWADHNDTVMAILLRLRMILTTPRASYGLAPKSRGFTPGYRRGGRRSSCNRNERYDINENDETSCTRHRGEKTVDCCSDFWADHDERCHGRMESLNNDPDWVGGFMWSCCEAPIDAPGCESSSDEPKNQASSTTITTVVEPIKHRSQDPQGSTANPATEISQQPEPSVPVTETAQELNNAQVDQKDAQIHQQRAASVENLNIYDSFFVGEEGGHYEYSAGVRMVGECIEDFFGSIERITDTDLWTSFRYKFSKWDAEAFKNAKVSGPNRNITERLLRELRDYLIARKTIHPQCLQAHYPLDNGRLQPAPASPRPSIGTLDALPLEVLQMIFGTLNLASSDGYQREDIPETRIAGACGGGAQC